MVMLNPYVILAIAASVLLGCWRYGEMRYTAGADAVTAAYAASLAAEVKKEQADVKEIIKWKERQVIVYRDKIKEIKIAADPSGCIDLPLSDVGLSRMLQSGSDSASTSDDNADRNISVD